MGRHDAIHECEDWTLHDDDGVQVGERKGARAGHLYRCRACGKARIIGRHRWSARTYEGTHFMRDWWDETYVFYAPTIIKRVGCVDENADALDRIAALICGVEWQPDTLDRIAEIVRESGRVVFDVGEDLSWSDDVDFPEGLEG